MKIVRISFGQACNRLSAICVPVYDRLGRAAVQHILESSAVKYIFVSAAKFSTLASILTSANHNACKIEEICFWGESEEIDVELQQVRGGLVKALRLQIAIVHNGPKAV